MKMRVPFALALFAALAGAATAADVIELSDGLCVEGAIQKEEDAFVALLTAAGKREVIPRSKISRLMKGMSLLDVYARRIEGEPPSDARSHLSAGLWCEQQSLKGLAARHFRAAVRFDPGLETARLKLGHVNADGMWFESHPAAMFARGKIFFRGAWIGREDISDKSAGFVESDGDWFSREEHVRLGAGSALAVGDMGDGWLTVRTRHYRFKCRLRESKALMFGRLAEQAFAAFRLHFGFKPREILQGDVFNDLKSFEDFTVSLGLSEPGRLKSHGFFGGPGGRVYFPYVDDDYTTINILIHELCHQFEFLARPGAGIPLWFSEGIASVFSHHNLDSGNLRLAQLAVNRNFNLYYLQRIIETGAARSLKDVLEGGPGKDIDPVFYHHAWGLVWFLMNCESGGYARKFPAFQEALHDEARVKPHQELLVEHFGALDAVEKDFIAYIRGIKGLKWRGEGKQAGSGGK